MPHIVDIKHRGGIERISCRCLATVSVVGASMEGMSISRTLPSTIGFEAIIFILSRLAIETRIFI